MGDSPAPATIVVAARDEEERIARTVAALHADFPGAEVIVVDSASRDATAVRAEDAGAVVLRLPRPGKGQALSAGERAAAPGSLLLCDGDIDGSLRPLVERARGDLAVAVFRRRVGGGFGIAKHAARALVRLRTGRTTREPLSGQRYLSERARSACFPLAPGFGCEVRMTIDAVRAGLALEEIELDLTHRATGRDAAGFAHRGRQLLDAALAAGPLALNHRGLRLPLVGWSVGLLALAARSRGGLAVAAASLLGALDDAYAGPERGWAAHVRAGRTTGTAKLVAIPLAGALATRSLAGGVVVGLAANALNQLDTKPGRALKAFLAADALLVGPPGRFAALAVLLLPYDLRERVMLGDAGANALGAVLGLKSVGRFHGRGRVAAALALAAFNVAGDRRSLGALIESMPVLRALDRLGRPA